MQVSDYSFILQNALLLCDVYAGFWHVPTEETLNRREWFHMSIIKNCRHEIVMCKCIESVI